MTKPLILCLSSFGNAGQLAGEALVAGRDPVSALPSHHLLPCAGASPSGALLTALGVFENVPYEGESATLILQRTPTLPGHAQAFADQMSALITSKYQNHPVLIFGSCDRAVSPDPTTRVSRSKTFSSPIPISLPKLEPPFQEDQGTVVLQGGGSSAKVFNTLVKTGHPTAIIVQFTSE